MYTFDHFIPDRGQPSFKIEFLIDRHVLKSRDQQIIISTLVL